MTQPLDELYFRWLYAHIGDPEAVSAARTFWKLSRAMYTTEFTWSVPNDDNRVEDGKEMRYEFIDELGLEDVDPDWLNVGCSFLEMLIGLSRRLSFQAEGQPREWFWHLVSNLGIRYNDQSVRTYAAFEIQGVMDRVINRSYEPNGHGGLFPLQYPDHDQRRVELWYQMSVYLTERAA